jgi:Na+-translocating ferredoxin:NAD+ oxidoreductase RnfC subunit
MADEAQIAGAIRQRLETAGVLAGGLRRPAPSRSPTLVGRVADDEPLLHSEFNLGRAQPDRIVRGLGALALAQGARRVLLAVDPQLAPTMQQQLRGTRIELATLPPAFPLDAASVLCDLAQQQGRSVQASGLHRAQVVDAQTLVWVARAVEGHPPLRCTVTVAGQLRDPAVLQVPLGTSVADLVAACGGCEDPGWVAYHNGLLGGHRVERDRTVDLDTRGVVVLRPDHPLVVRGTTPTEDQLRRVPSACVNCRICTDICPVYLAGGPLEPHRIMASLGASWDGSELDPSGPAQGALACLECGLCSTLCPTLLRPAELVARMAHRLREGGAEPPAAHVLRPHPDRQGRRQSRRRLVERLGLTDPPLRARPFIPETVSIAFASPAGGTRVPVVSAGDRLSAGDPVALAPAGSAEGDRRSPVPGVVLAVDPDDGVVIQVR